MCDPVLIFKVKNRSPDEIYEYRDNAGKPIYVNFADRIDAAKQIVDTIPRKYKIIIIPDFIDVSIMEPEKEEKLQKE
jgi:hypothetical protein